MYSSATDQRQGGVGLLMSKHIYKCLQSVTPVTKRIISATFHGNPQLTVTSVYAPTECSLHDDKDDFYNDLNNHLTVTSVYAPTECSLHDDKDDFYNDLNNHLEQMT